MFSWVPAGWSIRLFPLVILEIVDLQQVHSPIYRRRAGG